MLSYLQANVYRQNVDYRDENTKMNSAYCFCTLLYDFPRLSQHMTCIFTRGKIWCAGGFVLGPVPGGIVNRASCPT